jgi:Demerecviridae HNH endonuclease
MSLTAERLRDLLDYDPLTGVFSWRVTRSWLAVRGTPAGSKRRDGRTVIHTCGGSHLASRLAWLWMTGDWPAGFVDHKDTDPTNDRWDNLRMATNTQNNANTKTPRHNTTGLKGVSRSRSRYRASITVKDKSVHLGVFNTPIEAHAAYCRAAEALHGEFARAA